MPHNDGVVFGLAVAIVLVEDVHHALSELYPLEALCLYRRVDVVAFRRGGRMVMFW